MTYHINHARSGFTAIAAVLALSSTPLFAQETAVPEPVTETASEPSPAADPLAPEPNASEPVASEPEATQAAPASPASTRRETARARTRAAAPASAPRVTEPSADPVTADPIAVPPPPADPAAMPIAEPAAPPVAEPVPAATELMTDEMVPIAGGAGLAILAFAGIGLAVRSRRRRREELAHATANQQYLNAHPEPATEPGFVRPSEPVVGAAATAPEAQLIKDAPRTRLPSGFDLSRFGPHVRAAYLGPTPDNPSLSLKYRLRRAAAMDQRARLEDQAQPVAAQPAFRKEAASKPAWQLYDEGFMFRKAADAERKPSRATHH